MTRLPRTLEEFEGAMWERLGDNPQLTMSLKEFERLNLLLVFEGKPPMNSDKMTFCGMPVIIGDINVYHNQK